MLQIGSRRLSKRKDKEKGEKKGVNSPIISLQLIVRFLAVIAAALVHGVTAVLAIEVCFVGGVPGGSAPCICFSVCGSLSMLMSEPHWFYEKLVIM